MGATCGRHGAARRAAVWGAAAVFANLGAAQAVTLGQSQSLPEAPGGTTAGLTFDKFDPALGALTDVGVSLTATVDGSVSYESREAAPSSFFAAFTGNIAILRPDNTPLVVVATVTSTHSALGAYDGGADFGGASGGQASGLTSSASWTTPSHSLPASDAALFTGPGPITLPVTIGTQAHVAGAANLTARLSAQAGATATLTYDYVPGGTGSGNGGDSSAVFTSTIIQAMPMILPYGLSLETTATQTRTLARVTTGSTRELAFGKFDPDLGQLVSVKLNLASDVAGHQGIENLGGTDAAISTSQLVKLILSLAGNPLADTQTSFAHGASLSGFDGGEDFAGSSGVAYDDIGGHSSDFTIQTLLDQFTGDDDVNLDLATTGTSDVYGPGDMILDLAAEAGATVRLSYTYIPCSALGSCVTTLAARIDALPMPGGLAYLAPALIALGAWRRRRSLTIPQRY
jgi:hypothetical protein